MAIPTSRSGFILPALIKYLDAESLPYKDDLLTDEISWDYPSDVHSVNMNPKGKIYFGKIMSEQRTTPYKTYEIVTRLLVSHDDESKLECLLLDWEDLIVNSFFFKLSQHGYSSLITNAFGEQLAVSNLFLKIRLLQSNIYPRINQAKGGTGGIQSVWQWTDYETISNQFL